VAAQAEALSGRVRYPTGEAAALEAKGAASNVSDALGLLRQARQAWSGLGRALDAARCDLVIGHRLREQDPGAASEALAAAAAAYEKLGVEHLAASARALALV
jgi:hypothetical protein